MNCPRRVPIVSNALLAVPALLVAFGACGPDAGRNEAPESATAEPLVLYSGRSESLVAPLLASFSEATGVEIEVRYGGTSELAATILEEGEHSPAHAFLSQDAAALGALSGAGRLSRLAGELLDRVPAVYRSPGGDWVGVSGRARSVVFEPSRIVPEELPTTLAALGEPRYQGRFGVAPTNGSFQAHMAVVRAAEGAAAADAVLAAIASSRPQAYPKNGAIVEAVIAGEIDFGLVNHYYLWRAKSENPEVTARNFFMPEGVASSFVNVAGVGLLRDSEAGRQLVEFLLGDEAQRYFAVETFEYPLVAGVEAPEGLPELAAIRTPEVDFGAVSSALAETLQAIDASGLIR